MQKTAGHILKSEEVRFEGRVQLGAPQPGSNLAKNKSAAPAMQQVRIVENNPEYAVVEVICRCGTKTYIRCDYSSAEPAGTATTAVAQTNR